MIASWVLLSLILTHLCTLVIWRDLRCPQPGHRYNDCFLGLAFFNLDPSIHFSDFRRPSVSPTWASVYWLLLAFFNLDPCIHFLGLQSWSIHTLLLGLAQYWSTFSRAFPLRLLEPLMSHAWDAPLFILYFPAFRFNRFSQSTLLKYFHCSFPPFVSFCAFFLFFLITLKLFFYCK